MTVGRLLAWATRHLKLSTSPNLDAEVLLAYVQRQLRSAILANLEQPVNLFKSTFFCWLVWKRHRGTPIAYLTGAKEFYGRNFKVTQATLIPRPATELLIDKALEFIRADKSINTVADIGTGSGCIAITLALEVPPLKIYASDISVSALRVAQKNAQTYKIDGRLVFGLGNLLKPLHDKKIDMVVANLPYVTPAEYSDNRELKFEPTNALLGQPNLLDELCQQISSHPETKYILLETSPRVLDNWLKILNKYFADQSMLVVPDLSGNSRLIIIDTKRSKKLQ